MSDTFGLEDLGLDIPVGDTDFTDMVGDDTGPDTSLVQGSVAAHALHSVFTGNPITLVNSPPGAGKSALISKVVAYLLLRTDLSLHVVAPTNNAASELASRIVQEAGPATALIIPRDGREVPDDVATIAEPYVVGSDGSIVRPERQVHVTTVHSAKQSHPEVDVMIVEEAYQVQYGLLAEAADGAEQLLMVGDPGQIGPVVAHDVTPWRGIEDAPVARAPEVLGRMDAHVLTLPSTYRIGQESVEAIAPLYPFGFNSQRDPKQVDGSQEIECLQVPDSLPSLSLARAVADRVSAMMGRTLRVTERDGSVTVRPVEQSDLCVIAALNETVANTLAELETRGLSDVKVGTADSLQGGQWNVVVAVDPLVSGSNASAHSTSNGRLCVMASRHMCHLTWVFSPSWRDRLSSAALSDSERAKAEKVRDALTSKPCCT